jgi:hypothetical protein
VLLKSREALFSLCYAWLQAEQGAFLRGSEKACFSYAGEEAIKNAQEVIELWIEDAQKAGEPIGGDRAARKAGASDLTGREQ